MSANQDVTLYEHVVEPGFNSVGIEDAIQALTARAEMALFDKNTRDVLSRKQPFVLVLGKGFEEDAVVREGLAAAPCKGLAGIDQLRFLQQHGLKRIVMERLHGTLAQNAKSVGIEVQIRKGADRG
jgi:hypothetical protein